LPRSTSCPPVSRRLPTRLSTGIVGADQRYVTVIESLQPCDDATARATITQAVKTMFPAGTI
jgi:hypothetical protein